MDAMFDPQPHRLAVLNLIHHMLEVVAEHARPHGLTARLEISYQACDDGVEDAKDGDEHMARLGGPKSGQSSSEDDL